jgi:hypothetical protein
MKTLLSDLRHAGKSLSKRPGFAFFLVLVPSLGIGGTTAVFSVVNGVEPPPTLGPTRRSPSFCSARPF